MLPHSISSLIAEPMRRAYLLLVGLIVWSCLAGAAQAAPFNTRYHDYSITSFESVLADVAKKQNKAVETLQSELAAAEQAGNLRFVASAMEALLAARRNDLSLWQRIGRVYLSAEPLNGQDRYELVNKALGASLYAYKNAMTPAAKADALQVVGDAFVRQRNWRPALNAYRSSLEFSENEELRGTYNELLEQHGFRITDYTVENNAAQPRVCFQFSDPVDNAEADFSKYFTQTPGPVSSVTVDGTRLCVEGLKHGGNYAINVRQGLPSSVEETLSRDYEYSIYVRDRSPVVLFGGKSYVLPRTGQNGIPLISVNSTEAKLTLYRIGDRSLTSAILDSSFLGQLYSGSARDIANTRGQKVWEGTMETASPLNEETTFAFPVDEALGKVEPGLYVMTAQSGSRSDDDEYNSLATQWFVVSDLGLTTMKGKDGLHVFLRSIADASPLGGVQVRLLARNNEVLGTATTDDSGAVNFAVGLTKGEGGLEPAIVVATDSKGDYGFLDITQGAFDLSDRGVAGRDPPGAVDSFVYVERGVYRRGETVHATILLRDEKANAIADAPVTAIVRRPDGVEYSRTVLNDQGAGGRAFQIELLRGAAGGTWRVEAYTDPKGEPVGSTTFLVEDYVPDRLEFTLKPTVDRIERTVGARASVDGRYLFGAPAANLNLEGDISVGIDNQPFEQWKNYSFGLTDESVETVQNTVEDLAVTDAAGKAEVVVPLPDLPTTSRPLAARVTVRMREPGGRALSRNLSIPVLAARPMLGVENASEVQDGVPASFKVIAVDPTGKAISTGNVTWSLKRLTTSYQWFSSGSNWNYESVTTARKIAGGSIDVADSAPAVINQTLDWGQYRLEVSGEGVEPASMTFYAGYYAPAKSDTPDMLPVALDRTAVRSGETVKVRIDARFEGKASVQVVGDRLFSSQLIDVPKGGIEVPVAVGSDWGTGAYVVVNHFRPMDVQAKRMPSRSIGLAWFGIDRDERTLKVALTPPAQMKPRQALTIPVKVSGVEPGAKAFVTVAAVDVGILNLTGYTPPEPEAHYFAQQRLSAELRDLYGQLIDGMQGSRGRIRSGGDGGINEASPPPTQAPLALFSGVLPVRDDGTVEVSFDIPAFNGTARVMAVAWTPRGVGHASADVIIRDPVVIAGTLPRFLANGDSSRFRLDLLNAEAQPGEYTLAVKVEGPVTAESAALYQPVKIGEAGSRTPVNIPITATGIGTATLTATLAGPGGVTIDQKYTLGILPANAPVTRRTISDIAPNVGSITVGKELMSEMVPGTAAVSVSMGPLTDLDVSGLLRELELYPYGCSEQLVSRALPLLYVNDLGGNRLGLDVKIDERMQETVARLLSRQESSGAFGLWNAGDSNLWLSAYVTDFLLRAREKGHNVPEAALTQAVQYLRNTVGNAPDVEKGRGQDTAYALYTLARAGKAPSGDIKYFADTKIEDFGSPLARAQVAAALGILGDKQRSEAAFASAGEALVRDAGDANRPYRYDYGSVLRDAAAIVALAGDTNASLPVVKAASTIISSERSRSRYASTQEMTWMVLAARAVADEAKALRLTVGGQPHEGAYYGTFREANLQTPVTVANNSSKDLKAVVAVSGSPKVPEPASSDGMSVTRLYFTQGGEPVDPATVEQNTRLVVVLQAQRTGNDQSGDFLLVDRLPAGFDIENPNLIGAGGVGNLPWLADTTSVTFSEFRDDRFVAAFSNQTVKVAYTIRAVAPGTYAHPGAFVEDMYRPERHARLASTTVTITAK